MRRKRRKSSRLYLAFTRERGVTREERLARIQALDRDRERRLAILELRGAVFTRGRSGRVLQSNLKNLGPRRFTHLQILPKLNSAFLRQDPEGQ